MSVLAAVTAGAGAEAQTLGGAGDRGGAPAGANQPAQAETTERPGQSDTPSISTSLPRDLADPGGVRATLERAGITYVATYVGDWLGVANGGTRRRSNYIGFLDVQFDADFERLAGWQGLALHGNVYQLHGRGVSGCCLGGNLMVASELEALPASRLYELYLEQKLLGGKLAIRGGQLAADTEFLVSQYAAPFINATFGWPAITAANLPNGGPAYPIATPGIRVELNPTDQLSLSAAVFNGDPVGPNGPAPPQRRDHSGLEFRTSDAALLIAEAAYAYDQEGNAGLPGTVKLGGWHHLGRFSDRRFGQDGLPLADSASSGIARRLRGNEGIYGVIDQLLYRLPGIPDGGVGAFVRASASPGDRNLVSAYLDGGLTFKGFVPGRPADTFGVAFGHAGVSGRTRSADRDARLAGYAASLDPETGLATAPLKPVRSSEHVIEATYQAQIVPGLTVQPDAQYIRRPGAGVVNPRDAGGAIVKSAGIFGLRATLRY